MAAIRHQVYTLAKELYPGRYRPTLTHSFIKVLHAHSLLYTCFTQNIDTLERRAGVPEKKIIEAHGSFATQRCIDCKRPYDDEKIRKAVMNSAIPRCEHCTGLVKPNIVFFGEAVRTLDPDSSGSQADCLASSHHSFTRPSARYDMLTC